MRRLLFSTLVLATVMSACGGDDGVSPENAALIGSWSATSSTFTEVAGGATFDEVAAGLALTIVFRSNLTYTLTEVDPGPPQVTEIEDGTFTVIGTVLTVIPDADPGDVTALEIVTLTSTTLTLFQADGEFDFNDDGIDTPAAFTIVFVRQ